MQAQPDDRKDFLQGTHVDVPLGNTLPLGCVQMITLDSKLLPSGMRDDSLRRTQSRYGRLMNPQWGILSVTTSITGLSCMGEASSLSTKVDHEVKLLPTN